MTATAPSYFNDITVDLDNELLFPRDIYERSKRNPNPLVSIPCVPMDDSLDEYADNLAKEILASLRG